MSLEPSIKASIDAFEAELTEEQYADPAYRYRVAFVPIIKQRESAADTAIKFFKADSEEAAAVNEIHLKEVDKVRYPASQIVQRIQDGGFPNFTMGDHTKLWKKLNAKRDGTPFGKVGDYKNSWVWFETWLEQVRTHCEESGDKYR
jgi:hypothetical protein